MYDGIISIPLSTPPSATPGSPSSEPAPFFAGPENALAVTAVRTLLDESEPRYNPLVLCGASGTGKSHLALSIASQWSKSHPGEAVHLTAADFARQTAAARRAAKTGDMTRLAELRHKVRGAGLLVLEDVAQLAARSAAQQELLNTLDERVAEGRQTVVTARITPREIDKLVPALAARLTAGLEVPLAAPEARARLAILKDVARRREITLSDDAAQLLAESLAATASELVGALSELDAACRLENTPLTAAWVRKSLSRRTEVATSVRGIASATARYFGLKVADLSSPSRRRGVVMARGVAVYLARQLTGKSLEQLGRHFGGRDHTTVLHGCRTTEERMKTDPAARRAVEDVRQMVLT